MADNVPSFPSTAFSPLSLLSSPATHAEHPASDTLTSPLFATYNFGANPHDLANAFSAIDPRLLDGQGDFQDPREHGRGEELYCRPAPPASGTNEGCRLASSEAPLSLLTNFPQHSLPPDHLQGAATIGSTSENPMRFQDVASLPASPYALHQHSQLPLRLDQMDKEQASPSDIQPNFLSEEPPLLLPSSEGFLVTTRDQSQGSTVGERMTHTPISWDSFLSFVRKPSSTSHLPLYHPVRAMAQSLNETFSDGGRPFSSPAYAENSRGRWAQDEAEAPTISFAADACLPENALLPGSGLGAADPQLIAPSLARKSSDAASTVPRTTAMSRLSSFSSAGQAAPPYFSTSTPVFPPPQYAADGAKLNPSDDHYIFSQSQGRLLRLGTKEAETEVGNPENTLITFKAGTVRETEERDGARALPAWTPAWPGSNEWLKAQYCAPTCLYERGFGNKRPVLIREHLRKCPLLSEDHPLKVLARLELDAHARAQWIATTQRALKRKREEETLTIPGL